MRRNSRMDSSGLGEAIEDLERLSRPPSRKTVAALEAALRAAFLDTQARVDTISGSLKASGRVSSELHGNVWTGRITYGGVSPGPDSIVDYALYELQEGGSHDFLRGLPAYEGRFAQIINEHFAGG